MDIDLNDPEVAAAATKIQAGFKGLKTRKELKERKEKEEPKQEGAEPTVDGQEEAKE